MVQVQSAWFPLIDRNPQRYLPTIYQAEDRDFIVASQRIHRSSRFPGEIAVPVVTP